METKLNPEVIQTLSNNLTILNNDVIDYLHLYRSELKAAEKINTVMERKSFLLVNLLTTLPLKAENCYHCLNSGKISKEKLIPGIAYSNSKSAYQEVVTARKSFIDIITNKYHTKDDHKEENLPVDKKVMAKLLLNIERIILKHTEIFITYNDAILTAKTISELMQAKKRYLKQRIIALPLGSPSCYYCVVTGLGQKHFTVCQNCQYAARHGICDKLTSDYFKINFLRKEFKNEIENYYC